ncbi:MAG: hypothetical protein ACLU80_04825 [Dorea sp.]
MMKRRHASTIPIFNRNHQIVSGWSEEQEQYNDVALRSGAHQMGECTLAHIIGNDSRSPAIVGYRDYSGANGIRTTSTMTA